MTIDQVSERDLADLVPLMGAYCDFYRADPGEAKLRALAEQLLAHPAEGLQLIARTEDGEPLGFATIYWSWSTLAAARIAIMNDLYVDQGHRRGGVGRALIEACRDCARAHGAVSVEWDTQPCNARAQALYDTVGAERSEWVTYRLDA